MKFAITTTFSLILASSDAFTSNSFSRQTFPNANHFSRSAGHSLPKTRLNYAASTSTFHETSDPYAILNLAPGVDMKEIKKAYRKMALKYHPDANRGNEKSDEEKQRANDTFAKINEAYAFLTGKSDEMSCAGATDDMKSNKGQRAQQTRQTYANPWNHQPFNNHDSYKRVRVNYGDDAYQRSRKSSTTTSFQNNDPAHDEARANHYYQRTRMNNSYYANGWNRNTVKDQYAEQGRSPPTQSPKVGVGARNVQQYDCNGNPIDGTRASHQHPYSTSKFTSKVHSHAARSASRVYSPDIGASARTASARNVQQYDSNGNIIDPNKKSSFKTVSNTWRAKAPKNVSGFQDVATKFQVRNYDINGNPVDPTKATAVNQSRRASTGTFSQVKSTVNTAPKSPTTGVSSPAVDRFKDFYARTSTKRSTSVNPSPTISPRVSEPVSVDGDFARAVKAMEERMKQYQTTSESKPKTSNSAAGKNSRAEFHSNISSSKDPEDMSIKELIAAIRSAGLESKAVGFMEKSEFVKLLKDSKSGQRTTTIENQVKKTRFDMRGTIKSKEVTPTASTKVEKDQKAETKYTSSQIDSSSTIKNVENDSSPVTISEKEIKNESRGEIKTEQTSPKVRTVQEENKKNTSESQSTKIPIIPTAPKEIEIKVNTFGANARVTNIYDSRRKANPKPVILQKNKTPSPKSGRTWLSAAEKIKMARAAAEANKELREKEEVILEPCMATKNDETEIKSDDLTCNEFSFSTTKESKLEKVDDTELNQKEVPKEIKVTKFDICDAVTSELPTAQISPKINKSAKIDIQNEKIVQTVDNKVVEPKVTKSVLEEVLSKKVTVSPVLGEKNSEQVDFKKRRSDLFIDVANSVRNSQKKVKELRQKTTAHRIDNERKSDMEFAQMKARELRQKRNESFEDKISRKKKAVQDELTFEAAIRMKNDETATSAKKNASKALFSRRSRGGVLTKFRYNKPFLALRIIAEFFLNIPGFKIARQTYLLGAKCFKHSTGSKKLELATQS